MCDCAVCDCVGKQMIDAVKEKHTKERGEREAGRETWEKGSIVINTSTFSFCSDQTWL